MAVDPSDFLGEINIPNTDEKAVREQISVFTDKYEPLFYKSLMGQTLYAEYLTASPNTQKWANIDRLFYQPLLYYVYYWWIRNQRTYQGRQGTIKSKVENAEIVSPGESMVFVWNGMVDMVHDIANQWDVDVYGTYYLSSSNCNKRPDIFYKQNNFNI